MFFSGVAMSLCFLLLGCFLFFSCNDDGFVLEFSVLGCDWFSSLNLCFMFDWLSFLFGYMLLCCGGAALVYCGHYFYGQPYGGLMSLMIFFLFVMLLLVFSGNLLLTAILWEYLGFVSFLLILYYSNMSSFRASVVTLVSSRFGDVGLFVGFCWFWGFFDFCGLFVSFCLFLVVVTKSACFPFMSWLLEAMRAPTPVSSLVHSSTLVAAGVWFLFRYGYCFSSYSVWWVFVVSCISVLLSGLCACCFMDAKKMVALSTCNNISWCLLFFVCGDLVLACCQLLLHGLCKCFLFMSAGDLMSSSGSSQSCVGFYSLVYSSYLSCFLNFILIFCLCGLPFMGVFFVKHCFFSYCVQGLSGLFMLFLLFGFFLSYSYSFRLFVLLCGWSYGLVSGCLCIFLSLVGLAGLSFFVCLLTKGVLEEVVSLSVFWSLILLFVQVGGSLFGWLLGVGAVLEIESYVYDLFGCDSLVVCLYDAFCSLGWVICGVIFRWEVCLSKMFLNLNVYYVHKIYGFSVGLSWLGLGVIMILGSCFLFS